MLIPASISKLEGRGPWFLGVLAAVCACSDPEHVGLSAPVELEQAPCRSDGDPDLVCTTPFPEAVRVADFNADGVDDLLVHGASGDIDLLVDFTRGEPLRTTLYAGVETQTEGNKVILCDLDADGATDVIFSERYHTNATSWLQRGSMMVPANISVPTNFAQQLQCADLDRDGAPDLLGIGLGTHKLRVRLGTLDGRFGPPHDVAPALQFDPGYVVEIVKLSGSDRLDFLMISGSTVEIRSTLLLPSDHGLAEITSHLLADLDGDAMMDLVLLGKSKCQGNCSPGQAVLLRGAGDPGDIFVDPMPVELPEVPNGGFIGDLVGDALPEIILGSFPTDKLTILRRTPEGPYALASRRLDAMTTSIAIADLDGDATPELVAVHPERDAVKIYRDFE